MSLSNKRKPLSGEIHKGAYWEEDVKEFIKLLKRDVKVENGKIKYTDFLKIINQCAGEKLIK